MELIRRFPADVVASALQDWGWLADLSDKTPLVTSAFGDVFLQAPNGVWFLDTLEGKLTREWADVHELQEQLNTPGGQDRFLMAGVADDAYSAGLRPGDAQVLSFKVLPVLGGAIDVANLEIADLDVALSLTGQIHRQVKDLPPGTPISNVSIGE